MDPFPPAEVLKGDELKEVLRSKPAEAYLGNGEVAEATLQEEGEIVSSRKLAEKMHFFIKLPDGTTQKRRYPPPL